MSDERMEKALQGAINRIDKKQIELDKEIQDNMDKLKMKALKNYIKNSFKRALHFGDILHARARNNSAVAIASINAL